MVRVNCRLIALPFAHCDATSDITGAQLVKSSLSAAWPSHDWADFFSDCFLQSERELHGRLTPSGRPNYFFSDFLERTTSMAEVRDHSIRMGLTSGFVDSRRLGCESFLVFFCGKPEVAPGRFGYKARKRRAGLNCEVS